MEDELIPYDRLFAPQSVRERAYWACYRFLHRWFSYSEWRYRVRHRLWGFFQRGWRGYADHDVWGLDHYLAGVMAGGLRRLADTHHGFPVDFLPGYQTRWEHAREETDAASLAWEWWLLDKAEWFDWYARDEDGTTGDTNWIDRDLSTEEISRRIAAHQDKMQRFHDEVMVDFGRRFGSLWD